MIAALVAVVVIVAGFIFFNPFGWKQNPPNTAKRQLEQVQRSKKLNMNQVKKKKDYLKKSFCLN